MIASWNPLCCFKSTGFTSSTFPIQPDIPQNQPAAITLNTGSPRTLGVVTPPWRMENYHCRPHVVRIYALFTHLDLKSVGLLTKRSDPRWKKQPHVENNITLHKKFSSFSILQSLRMDPPPFNESVPRHHSPFSKDGKKEVWQLLLHWKVRDRTKWLWRCVGTALGHFSFGLSQCRGHGSVARVWSGPY